MNAPMLSGDGGAVLDIAITPGADGASRLVRRRVSYPWSLGRGYPGAGAITVIPQAAGAGLLAGDCFCQQIAIGPGAALQLAPAGATLVHGATPQRAGRSSWRYILGDSARASIASEPYVLMQDANLVLRQDLVVDANALLVATEAVVLAPGVSRASWRLETTASRPDGTRLFRDIQCASAHSLQRIGALPNAYTAFATVLIVAPPTRIGGLQETLDVIISDAGPALWGGCAPLRADAGLGIRLVAQAGGPIRDMAHRLHHVAWASFGSGR